MPRFLSAGIDIGSYHTRVVVLENDGASPLVRVAAAVTRESSGVLKGYIANTGEAALRLRETLNEAEKKTGERIKRVILSIGGVGLEGVAASASVLATRVDGEITDTDVEKTLTLCEDSLNLANKIILHRLPIQYKLDGKEVFGKPHGMQGVKLEAKALFVTILAQHLDDAVLVAEKAGVAVEDVVAGPLAASIATLSKKQRVSGCVTVNIGADTVSLAVFENDLLTSLQVLPLGSAKITDDIALGFKIPLEEAEGIKRAGKGPFPQKKLDEIVDARLKDIFELIETHLKKLGRNGLLPAGVMLLGGGSALPSIAESAKITLKLPAQVAVPKAALLPKEAPIDASWAAAYGAAFLGFDENYQSDLNAGRRGTIHTGMSGFKSWIKQFFP